MKKVLFSLLLVFFALSLHAESKTLVITFNDNTTQMFSLSDQPDISMANDKMTITAGETTAEYDLYKIRTFTFGTTAGIGTISADTQITRDGDQLIIPGNNNQVRIFSLDGKVVHAAQVQTADATSIDISSLSTGVYVIHANGKSVKITKK